MKASNFANKSRALAVYKYMREERAGISEVAMAFGCTKEKIKEDIKNIKGFMYKKYNELIDLGLLKRKKVTKKHIYRAGFKSWFKKYRKENGMTQIEIAKKAKISRTTVSNIENKDHTTKLETIEKIKKNLGVI